MEHNLTRRGFVGATGALAGLALAGSALNKPGYAFAADAASKDAGDAEGESAAQDAAGYGNGTAGNDPAEEAQGITTVWGHCAINCPGRCALKFHVKDDQVLWVDTYSNDTLDLDDPQPRACLRGRSYRRWMYDPDRIYYPMRRVPGTKRGDGRYERISWDEALTEIAAQLQDVIDNYGNEAVYINYATGVSATTSRPFGRLMNMLGGSLGYYGSYSSAQYSWIAPYMWGGTPASSTSSAADADLVLVFGSSPVETRQGGAGSHHDWVRARENNKGKILIFDPRLSDSLLGHSDQWQPINPGTDAAFVSAVAHELIANDQVDHDFLDTYCVGFDESTMPESAQGQHKSYTDYIMGTGYDMVEKTPEWAAPICGIPAARIREIAQMVADAESMYVVQGWGNQRHCNGEMSTLSICMLPILTGNIGLPGTNTGLRESRKSTSLKSLSAGENPVKTQISVFSMVDAIERGPEMTEVADGVTGKEHLDVPIKFVWNYAGNCITNQNADINHVHDVMADESLCQFVVGSDIVMTDSLKYCDIILPDLFRFEQYSMISTGEDDSYIISGTPAVKPHFEQKTCYEATAELADKFGLRDQFTEGKSELDWIKDLYEQSRADNPDLPTYDELTEQGVLVQKSEEHRVGCEAFRKDPAANPLGTPSGKIEIYSEALDQYIQTHEFADDEFVAPVPVYAPEWYGVETTTEDFPLVMSDFHYRGRLHSSWGNVELLKAANPQEVWINPADAAERGIAQGDQVRVTSPVGTIQLLAKVTPRVVPGVVVAAQGAWHDANMDGDRVDYGGCTNTLATLRGSSLAKGNSEKSVICQVYKA